jgi:hypothetical protein
MTVLKKAAALVAVNVKEGKRWIFLNQFKL